MRRIAVLVLAVWCAAPSAFAQESPLGAAFRQQGEKLKESCSSFGLKKIASCGQVLVTEKPIHVSIGSIAPKAGVGFGGAFVFAHNAGERWRLNMNADAVRAMSGSWRAGAYLKAVLVPSRSIKPTSSPTASAPIGISARPEFNAYFQSASLVDLPFFGIGPLTTETNQSFYGMRQDIVGGNAIVPVFGASGLSLFGEVNGRSVDIRSRLDADGPAIEEVYLERDVPGLSQQPAFVQTGEGIRFNRNVKGLLTFRYAATVQQFAAMSDDTFSFRRMTVDLTHEIALYRLQSSGGPNDIAGPNESPLSLQTRGLQNTRNREGTVELSVLWMTSETGDGRVVPFYFQPTLGGSDINGTRRLASYEDYRFRAPNLVLLRAAVEHSIWGPLGVAASADAGRVADRPGDLGFQDLRRSYSAGFTIRAGGFPQFSLLYAWGGSEGTHTIAHLNSTALGGGARPSLY